MGIVSVIIQQPFYPQPSWLKRATYRENVVLSRLSSIEDAILFITMLCGYNHIDVERDFTTVWEELIETEDIALRGGIVFEDEVNGNAILPSCCCGLESWREVLEGVVSMKAVWLGHDPAPTIEYEGDIVRIWSDDHSGKSKLDIQASDRLYFVEFNRDDLINKIRYIETDLLDFYHHVLKQALAILDAEQEKQLYRKYCEWFSCNPQSIV